MIEDIIKIEMGTNLIKDYLHHHGGATLQELCENIPEFEEESSQSVLSLLLDMMNTEEVDRTFKNGAYVYHLTGLCFNWHAFLAILVTLVIKFILTLSP